ncbi:DExH-box ATP-dependent RNA helicase [Quillaja saponaria]|uniref:DExH-box ATP-dependent RNA helicase n=1 Tax=Quillaja saponaria TaxID=32244 RepID=A0AAD7LVE5_QUISA|nr:DExH-box ATP-dependent RNA helicase [Quillaja saponaria]
MGKKNGKKAWLAKKRQAQMAQNPSVDEATKNQTSIPKRQNFSVDEATKTGTARQNRQNGSVDESAMIRISKLLDEFRATKDKVYTFEPNLSKNERAIVHQLCRKMGMESKSSGRGNQRRISVYKNKRKVGSDKGLESLPCLRFSEETKEVLMDLFIQYPPGDGDLEEELVGENSDNAEQRKRKKDDFFCKPLMNKEDIANKLEKLASAMEKAPGLTKKKPKLPIASFKDIITSTIDSHQVVLISGETGCGKTTQVPQFILDHIWGKGDSCKIICSQPRRISATSVAERIASERGENVGENVGYKIRLESKGGRHSSILLCTNGVLLRVLVSKNADKPKKEGMRVDDYSGITHIVMDEIHERDRYSDFMMAIIRDMLPSYPHLHLILMSATIDAERFSHYFGGCPVINVPGFTYPVRTFYLEDVLSIVKSTEDNHLDNTLLSALTDNRELDEEDKFALDEAINLASNNDELDSLLELVSTEGSPKLYNYQHRSTGLTPLMVFVAKGRVGDICMLLSLGADCHLRAKDGTTALEIALRENQQEAAEILKKHMGNDSSNSMGEQKLLDKYLATVNPELVDVVLIEKLLRKICTISKDGGVLVFLPGWDDINKTRDKLLASPFFKDTSKFIILSLHSMVPSMEQKKVFKHPPPGYRKIILSTNIAETAITIDDVVYVIDTGRMKEKSYDPYNNVSTLQSSWISKASAKQREGRAGRCQPGICYHLYSKIRASSIPDFQIPEIKRMPIEELCLQVKLLDPSCKIEDFLRKTLDPPISETIHNAIIVLQDIGALSLDEKLTQLGEKLGALPVHPLTSKMLFFAILMNCLDPALTIACASEYRDPFTLPMLPVEKKKAAAAKLELASLYGGRGDQLAVVAAFDSWKNAKARGEQARFCSQYFVSSSTMSMLSGMRMQLQKELIRTGFILQDVSSYNSNAHDTGILHAVLVAGLYPNVGRLSPPNKSGKKFMVETASGDKIRLHSHSTNYMLSFGKTDDRPLIVYDEVTRGDGGMNIRNCTLVGALPLLLLSTEIAVASAKEDDDDNENDDADNGGSDDGDGESQDGMEIDNTSGGHSEEKLMSSPDNSVRVVVDRWLYFRSTALDVAQIYCLRERLSVAMLYKVKHAGKVLPPVLGDSLHAIACILSYDGLFGIPNTLECVDSLASMEIATDYDNSLMETRKVIGQKGNKFPVPLVGKRYNNTKSFSSQQVSRVPVSMGTNNLSSPSSHNVPPMLGSAWSNQNQNRPSEGPGLNGNMGENVPRHRQRKRNRGNLFS